MNMAEWRTAKLDEVARANEASNALAALEVRKANRKTIAILATVIMAFLSIFFVHRHYAALRASAPSAISLRTSL